MLIDIYIIWILNFTDSKGTKKGIYIDLYIKRELSYV